MEKFDLYFYESVSQRPNSWYVVQCGLGMSKMSNTFEIWLLGHTKLMTWITSASGAGGWGVRRLFFLSHETDTGTVSFIYQVTPIATKFSLAW